MSALKPGERWAFVPPTATRAWGITVIEKGAYREPTLAELDHLRAVYEAALNYGRSEHTHDSNCLAGDCDSCSAAPALEALEALVGRP